MKVVYKILRTLLWVVTSPLLLMVLISSFIDGVVAWVIDFLFTPFDKRITRKEEARQKHQPKKEVTTPK